MAWTSIAFLLCALLVATTVALIVRTRLKAPAVHKKNAFRGLRDTVPNASDAASADRLFLAVIRIERFDRVRRGAGYRLANEVVGRLCERISERLPKSEIGRIGRDAIELCFRAQSVDAARRILEELQDHVHEPISVSGHRFDLKVLVGFADSGGRSIDDELIDRAELAVITAEKENRRFAFAAEGDQKQLDVRLRLMRDLRSAIEHDELMLAYQPKLRARTGEIDSVEALLRWHHPEQGLIAPDLFIGIAEDNGAIRPLTEWTVERALADQRRFAAAGWDLRISINLAGNLLPDRGFAEWALARIVGAGGSIGFEITETAIIDDPGAAIANLKAFHEAGVRIAIDDYGSGLSSLAYLKQLPAQELKIDRMFVSGLTSSHRDPLLVRSSIDLAHALEMEVTAEGVDDPMTLSLLKVMGCDLVQGFYISKPLPPAKLIEFLGSREGSAELHPPVRAWPFPPARRDQG